MKPQLYLGLGFLALIALLGAAPAQGQPTATQNATATVEVAAPMEPPPTNCGILAEPLELSHPTGSFIGTWPMLIAIPNSSDQHQGIMNIPNEHLQTDERLPGWWGTKVAWFVSESYQGAVKVRVVNVQDGSPMYIQWNGNNMVTTAEFDPKESFSQVEGSQGWAFFPSFVWVSKAGCYRFEAEWDGGAWRQIVAVGDVKAPR